MRTEIEIRTRLQAGLASAKAMLNGRRTTGDVGTIPGVESEDPERPAPGSARERPPGREEAGSIDRARD